MDHLLNFHTHKKWTLLSSASSVIPFADEEVEAEPGTECLVQSHPVLRGNAKAGITAVWLQSLCFSLLRLTPLIPVVIF